MINYLKKLISDGESQTLDFKYNISSASKISKTLVSFANTDGGSLLIGVKDNGVIIGVESEEEKYMIEYAAESFCKPIISFEMVEWEFEGKTVLQVIIDKSNIQPHYSKDENGKWLVYIRQYDENILADKVYVEVLKRQNKDNKSQIKYSFAESQLIEYLSNNQKITFKEFCKIGKVPPYVAERILVNMIGMGIINIIHSVNGAHFTLGTIL